jgi:hypothetical protein
MHLYHIEFVYDGETEPCHKILKAGSPGAAQWRFHQQFPGCRIVRQWAEARAGNRHLGVMAYEAVSTAKVEPLPTIETKEQTFSFFDDCRSTRPFRGRDQ